MAQYVKLGPKASFFRAASIDLSIAPGEVVALNARQMSNRLVRRAIHGGHLVLTQKEAPVKEDTTISADELKDSFLEMLSNGEESKKLAKVFSREDLLTIAKELGVTVDPDSKKVDIVSVIASNWDGIEEEETEEA